MDPVTGLAAGRIVVGSVSLLSPALAARLFLLDPTTDRQLGHMSRLFGSREIALGALTLSATGAARQRLVQVGIAVDAADAAAGLLAAATGATSKRAGLGLAVVAAGAVASGASALGPA